MYYYNIYYMKITYFWNADLLNNIFFAINFAFHQKSFSKTTLTNVPNHGVLVHEWCFFLSQTLSRQAIHPHLIRQCLGFKVLTGWGVIAFCPSKFGLHWHIEINWCKEMCHWVQNGAKGDRQMILSHFYALFTLGWQ